MAELTAEYLDKKLAEQTQVLTSYVDGKIEKQTEHFDQKIDEQSEALARMVNAGFEEVYRGLDVQEQLERHEQALQQIKQVLKLA